MALGLPASPKTLPTKLSVTQIKSVSPALNFVSLLFTLPFIMQVFFHWLCCSFLQKQALFLCRLLESMGLFWGRSSVLYSTHIQNSDKSCRREMLTQVNITFHTNVISSEQCQSYSYTEALNGNQWVTLLISVNLGTELPF